MKWKEHLEKIKDIHVYRDSLLKKYTTMGVGGSAKIIAEPGTENALRSLLHLIREEQIPFYILGGGSNVIFGDDVFDGIILRMSHMKKEIWNHGRLILGAGISTPASVKMAASCGWSGWEAMVGIPGSIGGAVAMNAGGKYGSISDALKWVRWMDFEGRIHQQNRSDISFEYRKSNINGIVLEAAFELSFSSPEKVKSRTGQILQEKKSSQPLGKRSAGCVFMNPPGESAGRLIEKAGLKGMKVGGAIVSILHGNFILNQNAARAEDIYRLIKIIQDAVENQYGIFLSTEVKMVNIPMEGKKAA